MFNLKKSQEKQYSILINNREIAISQSQIEKLIKNKLQNDFAVVKMFKKFDLSLQQLDNLKIQIEPLQDRYAETDADKMVLSTSLFDNHHDEDWFDKNYFIICHEILHFIYRNYERKAGYFGDHEEIDGFVLSIASLLSQNKSVDEIYNKIFPKIEFHFHDPQKAKVFFSTLIVKAKEFLM